MKTKTTLLILVLLALSLRGFSQIGIGTTTPHASAALDITSTTSGLLPPRMTEAQRNVISTPAAGLIVYCTNCGANGELEIFNGSAWVNMAGGTAAAGPIVADAPAIGTVTSSSSGQAVVPFTAPASNGGSSITSYTATSSPGGVTGTLSQSGSGSITVTGLTNGTAYTFTVTATNGIGTSLASTASNSVTPASVPDAPAIGTVTSSSSGQAVVPFTAPASNGGSAITSYTATSSPGGVTGTLSQSGSGSITVTGLTNGTSYTFTVTATNGIGTSLASTVSNSVTPLSTVVVNTTASTTLTFMAHNLGADYSLDAHIPVQGIHGNYYQWGRSTIVANASTSSAAIGGWITTAADNGAWADGSKTANDPCPAGYRVPTIAQWNLVDTYNQQTATGSFSNNETNFGAARQFGSGANTLTLPAAGYRTSSNGALGNRGNVGYYWGSSESGTYANLLRFDSGSAYPDFNNRTFGFSVRCVSE
jgi:uncharacterized protein (TIGR02145 family)